MDSYRLYVFNPISGRIDQKRKFLAKDDETAVWISEGLRHARPMELWHGCCKIHRWEPMTEASRPPEIEADEELAPAMAIIIH